MNLIFYFLAGFFMSYWIPNENHAITVYRPWADEGGILYLKKRFWVLEDREDPFWPCHIYFYFSPRTLKSFTSLGTGQNRSNLVNRLRWWILYITRVGMIFGQNSFMSQFREGGVEGVKNAKTACSLSKPIDRESKVVGIM